MVKKYYASIFSITKKNINFTYSYYFDKRVITLIVIGLLGAILNKNKNEK